MAVKDCDSRAKSGSLTMVPSVGPSMFHSYMLMPNMFFSAIPLPVRGGVVVPVEPVEPVLPVEPVSPVFPPGLSGDFAQLWVKKIRPANKAEKMANLKKVLKFIRLIRANIRLRR